MSTAPRAQDLRGALRLAADATTGLADVVEAMHAGIARLPGSGAAGPRTRGITGLVYRTVRGVTRLVGGSADALLGLVQQALPAATGPRRAEREALVAALNGVLGDHLAASGNPLAIPMTLRHAGLALPADRAALAERLVPINAGRPQAGARLLLLVHGLCMNDLQWQRQGHDHGAMLAQALRATPVYLHYNTGLPVAANGLALAQLLARTLAQWPSSGPTPGQAPAPAPRLVLLGHSMGGLVLRSALHQAAQAGLAWPALVDDLVCLGTPHHGAPLERAGHGVDLLLSALPYAAPLARVGQVRSAGITDLRHGRVLDDDLPRATGGQPDRGADNPLPVAVPLPAGPRCWALASRLAEAAPTGRAGALKDQWLGDGLVPVDSALGRHADPARQLAFAPEHQALIDGVGHLDLLSHPAVADQLRRWLVAPSV
ncbi:MAG: permease [Burkholderiales bacterium PBB5]|nr:MAG: permease [Burkholderiales bacterium PBB5]